MHDRRKHRRRAALPLGKLKAGKIVADGKLVAVCVLHDVSKSGACLSVLGTAKIPETFDLVLEAQGLAPSCRVAWKVEDRFGVRFTHQVTAVPAGAAAESRGRPAGSTP